MKKAIALLVITMSSLAACDHANTNSEQPTSPSAPPAPTSSGFRLSGVVFETTPSGLRPLPGGGVFFYFESTLGGHVDVDTSGRYTISGLPAGRFVRVSWSPSWKDPGLHQPCPVNATIAGDTERDIEGVRLGSREFTYGSPTLSGVVFEETASGRRPLMGARVLYSINRAGGIDAHTRTDANGRYQFCRVPRGAGKVGAGDCNDAIMGESPVEVNGDTVVDIDLPSFTTCPGGRGPGSGIPVP
jgi:hypothetical protein